MTRFTIAAFGAAMALTASVSAQQPPAMTPPGTVTLSLTEYNRLIDLAARPPQPVNLPPVAAVLSRATLHVRVDNETARGTFALSGEVLRAGMTRVPLIKGATLLDARSEGRAVPLVAEGGVHAALLQGPGPFAVTLEWGAPIALTPGRGSFVLPVPSAGSADATIDVPGEQADVRVSPGLVTRRASAGGRTVVDVTLDPGSPAQVSWSMRDRAPAAVPRDVRTLADVMTLVTIGESDVRLVALIDVSVVSGDPRTFDIALPRGYEMTALTGASIDTSERRGDTLVVTVSDPSVRRQQFLVSLERAHPDGSFSLETAFPSVTGAQRERGEIAIEGAGTLELSTKEGDTLHRMDVREVNRALTSLARFPLLAAFRYQHTSGTTPPLAFDVKRFADAAVLAAVAEHATVTTLITVEGRMLTEMTLRIQNRAQPFLKVALPTGASIVSVEVAGESAKPVIGSDGTRVPLLRPGFRPTGAYTVSFVYVHAAAPLARKGELPIVLPRLDVPIGLVEWELFVPDRYKVRRVDGNVIAADIVDAAAMSETAMTPPTFTVTNATAPRVVFVSPGQIVGRVVDAAGAPIPGVTLDLNANGTQRTAVSGADGVFVIDGVPSGSVTMAAQLSGFKTERRSFTFDQRPRQVDFTLQLGGVTETVTVTGESPRVVNETRVTYDAIDQSRAQAAQQAARNAPAPPSANVVNLQRRAAGVLPIRVEIPRAGTSHRVLKPLVIGEDVSARIQYTRR